MAARFVQIALNCHDVMAMERFYCEHFGFKRARVFDLGGSKLVFIKSGDMYLELMQAEGTAPDGTEDGPRARGVRHLGFQVDNVDAKLEAMGSAAIITLGPLDFDSFIPGWRTAWVKDPEGNIVEISQGYTDQDNLP